MSAATQSSLALVDKITAQVAGLSMNGPAAAAGGAAASGASFIPTETKDKRWWPIIPPGHTAYTFFGVDAEHPNGVINAEAATPAAAAAPASASAQPAAASTNATPAPKAEKPKAEKAKADKPAGGDKKAAAAPKAGAAAEPDQPDFTKLDIRVGQIVKAARHPDPKVESLYVEQIDCGDATGPRQVLSGLVKYIPLEQFQTMRVCVITNLKAGNLMGEMSSGMVLAASRGEGDARVVELVQPPVGSKPGDKIVVLDSSVDYSAFEPMAEVDGKKRNKKTNTFDNPWSRTAETLKTNEKLEATWNGMLIGTKEHGPCKAPSLANAQIA